MRGIQFDLRPLVSLYQCFPTRIDGLTSADFCRLGILVQTAMDFFEIWNSQGNVLQTIYFWNNTLAIDNISKLISHKL